MRGWKIVFYPMADGHLSFNAAVRSGQHYLYADWEHRCGYAISVANVGASDRLPDYCPRCKNG